MAAVSGADPIMASQCLDICQALVAKGVAFTLSLHVGSTITFTLDTREKEDTPSPVARKRPSPSTVRRNNKRKAEFLEKKQQHPKTPGAPGTPGKPSPAPPGSWRSSLPADTSCVGVKLTRKPKSVIPQVDGLDETPSEPEVEKKVKAVQTEKEAPVLSITKLKNMNLSGNPGPLDQPYRPPHTRDVS